MAISSVSALNITSQALSKAEKDNKVSTSNLNNLIKSIKSLKSEKLGGDDFKKTMGNLSALNKILNQQNSHVKDKKSERIISAGALLVNKNPESWDATRSIASSIQNAKSRLDGANSVLNGTSIVGSGSGVRKAWQRESNNAERKLSELNGTADIVARKIAERLIK
ncbi:hypothetical protein [Citrobacter portucalensis]|uniref:hypothetical protein n=1 Tax=Citrobacter portucalensis TaxID=1639133 RepID=UPI00226B0690|nr:hypothetical protein [Citrobacter portucalensis]MCX8986047.1 hypothetical protein [Citrobacter portucalensis]